MGMNSNGQNRIRQRNQTAGLSSPALCFALVLWSQQCAGVVFESTGDPEFNTVEPAGEYSGSGWQWQGRFGLFSGTLISPRVFISARHIGGEPGDNFDLGGESGRVLSYCADPESDLILWKLDRGFSSFAPLADRAPFQGREVIAFGRGSIRGEPVHSPPLPEEGQLRGWAWGDYDGRLRWGTNLISGYRDAGGRVLPSGSLAATRFVECRFDAGHSPHECHLSRGDSGGGLFFQSGGGQWLLLAVHHSVSGPYRLRADGPDVNASLFDTGSVYTRQNQEWVRNADDSAETPGYFLGTLIPPRLEWIRTMTSLLENDQEPLSLTGSDEVSGEYQTVPDLQVDWVERTISIPVTGRTRFFRLESMADFSLNRVWHSNEPDSRIVLSFR